MHDLRFPTSRTLDGSDAMHRSPDYSAAYVVLHTDDPELSGHGLTFTNGRGTEICVAAIRALEPLVVGRTLEGITGDFAGFWRSLVSEDQLRWLGPEKGVMHLSTAAIVNAVWDLWAKTRVCPSGGCSPISRPTRSSPPSTSATSPTSLRRKKPPISCAQPPWAAGARERAQDARVSRYTTSAGWLGYDDEKVEQLVQLALLDGFRHVKMKVGGDIASDVRRAGLIRDALGDAGTLMMDANQVWNVDEAIAAMRELAAFDPWWIEEPTSPDDVLGHARIREAVAPIEVATGEHVQNRIIFKQLLQARAIDVLQIDACRVAGVNEVLAILLLAAKFGVPVCPHAGGVGLCEYVQHLAAFDYLSVSGSTDGRVIEWVDHLHEHFVHPAAVVDAHYLLPEAPGYSIEMHASTFADYEYPHGRIWSGDEALVD